MDRRRRSGRSGLAVLATATALAAGLITGSGALAADPTTAGPPGTGAAQAEAAAEQAGPPAKVIVRFRQPPGKAGADLIRAAGGQVRFAYRAIPAIAATVPEQAIAGLSRNPNVLGVERDGTIAAFDHGTPTGDLEYDNQWGVAHIGAKPVHDAGITGAGIKVAVIDTGIDYIHYDPNATPVIYSEFVNHLVNGKVPGWDFVNGDDDPYDDNGHGTHVAGILAAEKNGYLISGVAPNVELYALKVLGATGEGDYSGLMAALDWSIANDIDLVNISLGGHDVSQALADMVAAADAAGVVMVAASGNVTTIWEIFYGCAVAYPAAYPQVLATTFTNEADALTGYSCTGNEVDFASPGDQIVSTVPIGPVGSCMFCDPKGYSWQSGTSMASPHLAGLVALVLDYGIADSDADGRLMPEVKAHLCANTVPGTKSFSGWTYAQLYGCGVINARKALIEDPPDTGGPPPPPPPNSDPVAVDDTATTPEDTAATIAVLANDDADGDTLTVTSAGPAGHGTVVVNAGGSVTYSPAADWHGADAFAYTISDGRGGTSSASVAVAVTAVNDAPTAVDDTATTPEDTAATIAVLANDTDVDGDQLTVVSAGPAGEGSVVVNGNGTVTYTPAADAWGTDTFPYTVSDGHGGTDTSSVTVNISAVNDAPTAAPKSVSTAYQTAVAVTLTGSDLETCDLTFQVVSPPANGTLSLPSSIACSPLVSPFTDSSSVTYTPAAGFSGPDSFTYRTFDGSAGSSVVAVSITVQPGSTIHIGDLDGSRTLQKSTWTARVTIRVHTGAHAARSGATVVGSWSIGGTASCRTGSTGACSVSRSKIPTSTSDVWFIVTGASYSGATYVPAANHDPDADSDGTGIRIVR